MKNFYRKRKNKDPIGKISINMNRQEKIQKPGKH